MVNVKHKSYVRYVRSGLNYIVCGMTTFQTAEQQADCYTYHSTPINGLAPCFDLCIVEHKN